MSDMFDSLEAEMAELRRELEAVKAERDWAHREMSEWRERHDALFDEALRLKAQWQAEAVEAMCIEIQPLSHRCASILASKAGELRRQAGEAR